jgi:ADP-dependent NAD(P)H-hydrate dehydratase
VTARSRGTAALTPARLRRMPLPRPDAGGDKEDRGRVLVAGGERQNPGALVLAGTAALRAGAGKLRLAAPASIAVALGVAVPEARVMPLAETKNGAISPRAARELAALADAVDAFLLGPGMIDEAGATPLTRAVLARLQRPAVVLDAGCFPCLAENRNALRHLNGRVVITPHAGEMARILDLEKEAVEADPLAIARRAAEELGAVVALKGATTFIAAPDGEAYRYDGGDVGLATSGSGDVLAGMVAGLLARGATPMRAAAWAVYIHGEAGNVLCKSYGGIGFLARELLGEVLRIMGGLA